MSLESQIYNILEAPLESIGYSIVRLRLLNRNSGSLNLRILEILIERLDEVHVSISDCKKASNHSSAILDVEDIIDSRYNLEVSSAGVERPLVKLRDFQKYVHYVIEMKLHNAVNESKKFQGTLTTVSEDVITLKKNNGDLISTAFSNIKDAKLVLTDELFRKIVK
jgi:ribosome maturation factor RimP